MIYFLFLLPLRQLLLAPLLQHSTRASAQIGPYPIIVGELSDAGIAGLTLLSPQGQGLDLPATSPSVLVPKESGSRAPGRAVRQQAGQAAKQ